MGQQQPRRGAQVRELLRRDGEALLLPEATRRALEEDASICERGGCLIQISTAPIEGGPVDVVGLVGRAPKFISLSTETHIIMVSRDSVEHMAKTVGTSLGDDISEWGNSTVGKCLLDDKAKANRGAFAYGPGGLFAECCFSLSAVKSTECIKLAGETLKTLDKKCKETHGQYASACSSIESLYNDYKEVESYF